ncbi:MAG: class I tRNA ligase family protein, partial [Candidatus Nanohaloarchaea archaeon]|nr:class I tRNA ligase family protein [Candidatus Nanohaloarchaea archaeon]
QDVVEEARESFDYWYPLDWRTTANELIENHLTFMVYHHAALFDEADWPQGIATWGLGTLEGEKMSSSKGHVKLPDEAIQEYGADTTRFFLFSSAEPWQDFDWRAEQLQNQRNKLHRFYDDVQELYGAGEERDETRLDRWLRSRLHRAVRETTKALEQFETRTAAMTCFFELRNAFSWYQERADTLHRDTVDEFLEAQVRLLAPFTPHLCEELWDAMGYNGLVAEAEWPEPDRDAIDTAVEAGEAMVQDAVDDIQEIAGLVDGFDTVRLIVAADWKRDAAATIQEKLDSDVDHGAIMGELTDDPRLREHGDDLAALVEEYTEQPGDLPDLRMEQDEEAELFDAATGFLTDRFDADVTVEQEGESDADKAGRARPGKPAIVLE